MSEKPLPSNEPAEDLGFRSQRPAAPPQGMLPGMAVIAIYMLFVAMVGGFGALNGRYPSGKYVILCVCTLMVAGVFGFLRLQRWGWSLVVGGCLSLCLWTIYSSHVVHNPGMLVPALLDLVMFLYLVRPEVRERLR